MFIFAIFVITSLCVSCLAQTEAQKSANQTLDTTKTTSSGEVTLNKTELDTSDWKTYKDLKRGFSFRYPSNLILQKKENGAVRLYHTVNFKHQDPCDRRDEPPVLKKLTDFDLTVKVTDEDFHKRKLEEADDDTEIELGRVNKAKGKIVEHSYDGCGYYEYVFPFKADKSFVLEHQIIGLFSPINADFPGVEEVRRQPDLIKTDEPIIRGILESFHYLKK